ncbi:unnamed protein product [Allacma fusca]|uniref:Uncharacterized protein n=1 Tax=Allacma fusca TaxID=39272 RepID=A0A8J2LU37_9HEXA|nr:unnamed protein product [Allacma fusca]
MLTDSICINLVSPQAGASQQALLEQGIIEKFYSSRDGYCIIVFPVISPLSQNIDYKVTKTASFSNLQLTVKEEFITVTIPFSIVMFPIPYKNATNDRSKCKETLKILRGFGAVK